MLCYDAGSRHDPPSRSGLAHFCEHLAFEGPAAERGGGSMAVERLSGAARAFTTQDRLCFSTLVPSGELGDLLAIEAERMAHPPAPRDDQAFEIGRRVLVRELRERS